MIDKLISEKVLTTGQDYINFRGGIGGVIDQYSKYFTKFKFICIYPSGNSSFIKWLPIYCQGICNLIRTLRTDRKIELIHMHSAAKGSFYRNGFIFIISKYFFGKKVVFHSHGSEFADFYLASNFIIRKYISFVINGCDAIICLSKNWESFFQLNFSAKQLYVLDNIIEYPKFMNENLKKGKLITFLFLGYIGNRKGIYDLLNVIIKNKQKWKHRLKFVIGGNGEIDKFMKIVTDNELTEIIDFAGWVSGEKKRELLNNCDVYILPSYNEGLPLSILEAMSYGKMIVSTNVGGIPEVVKNHFNGFIFSPGDLAAMEKSIDKVINDANLISDMGNRSQIEVDRFLPHNVIEKLNLFYFKILADE